MRKQNLALVLGFMVLPFPAFADGIQEKLRNADETLNKVYGQLQADLADQPVQALKRAQRAWIKYRDRKCAFEAGVSEKKKTGSVRKPGRPRTRSACWP